MPTEPGNLKIVDLTPAASRPEWFGEVYDGVAVDIRADYARLMGEISITYQSPLDWWLQAPASRNPVLSTLFHEVVCLLALQQLAAGGTVPDRIIVTHRAMSGSVHDLLNPYSPELEVRIPNWKFRLSKRIRNSLSPFRSMVRLLREWRAVRSTADKERRAVSATEAILVDTFAIPGHVTDDRYYPGMFDNAGSAATRIRLVPQYLGMSVPAVREAARQMRSDSDRYLLKEDWISFADLSWCFAHVIRIRRRSRQNILFRGVDITALVLADLRRHAGTRCAMRGLINYRFAGALVRAGQCPSRIVDWFENHPMDRGWNAGFRRWFPETDTIGYVGFYPAGQSYRPTGQEALAGILPSRLQVIGGGFVEDIKEFWPEADVSVGPAFRYQALTHVEDRRPINGRILVALPYFRNLAVQLVDAAIELKATNPELDIVAKSHPAQPLKGLPNHSQALKSGIAESAASLTSELKTASVIVVAAQASTLLESAAAGVPAVVVARTGDAMELAIPGNIPDSLYTIGGSGECIGRAVRKILGDSKDMKARRNDDAKAFAQSSFAPVNPTTTGHLLGTRPH